MALSFSSNWGSLEHHLHQEMSSFLQTQPELATDVLNFDCNSALADSCIDPLLEAEDSFYADNYTNLLPYFSTPSDYLISLSPEIFPQDELQSYQYLKRQKSCGNNCYSDFSPGFFDGYVPNPGLVPESLTEFLPPLPVSSYACDQHTPESTMKKRNRVSLSAQSIAARERRRKVTEKTQELGKLIHGGNKMNTAEMFQAAFKHVKYLQAQLSVLQIMGSIQETKEPLHTKELQDLLASPIIQEKLSSEEKCLVPKEFLRTLANDREVQSKPLLFKGVDQLLRTNC